MAGSCLQGKRSAFLNSCISHSKAGFLALMLVGLVGCGGGGTPIVGGPTPTPTPPPAPAGTTITVSFTTLPIGLAVQAGDGHFVPVPILASPDNTVSFTIPPGISKYKLAVQCLADKVHFIFKEIVLEATIQDGTFLATGCDGFGFITPGPIPPPPPVGQATGTLDFTNFFHAVDQVIVFGKGGQASVPLPSFVSVSFPFSVNLPPGQQDIAIVVVDNIGFAPFAFAIKILRNQTVPGVLNGGNPIAFDEFDTTIQQGVIFNPAPGFTQDPTSVQYTTVGGTVFPLANAGTDFPTFEYPSVRAGAVQSGDFYTFFASEHQPDPSGFGSSSVNASQNFGADGGPFNFVLPSPWDAPNPITDGPPAVYIFNYPPYMGVPANQAQTVKLHWFTPFVGDFFMNVTATPSFQDGANTITLPDPTEAGQGFFACCAPGSDVTRQVTMGGNGGTPPISWQVVGGDHFTLP